MTRQEIEAKISTIRNNNALPEKQKGMLLDKYEKMLVDATIGDSDAGKIAPAKEKKAPAPRKPRTPKEPKVTAPKTPAMGEPDCDDLFEQDRERKAKAAIAAEKRRNAPKKTEATKNTEAVEKASAKVEKSVEKRIKSGDVSIAEIKKIIEEYETALKKLRQLLTRAEGKMKFGGPVKDQDISKLADKARDISNHHCGCNDKHENGGSMYAGGGNIEDKLLKELHKLQSDLGSARLSHYREGDTSEEEMARRRERESKLVRFNEVLALLHELEDKKSTGGSMYSGGGDSGEMPTLKIVYPTKKSIARPVSKLMDDLNVDYSSIDFYDTEGGFEAAIIDLNKQKNGAEILSKFEAFEEKHRGDFWLIKLKADGSMYAPGGGIKDDNFWLDEIINTPWGEGRIYEISGKGSDKHAKIDIKGKTYIMNMGEIDEDDIVKYAGGGGTEERFNLSFNYNPGNLSNKDAERMVSHYTKDWKHDNDSDEVSFYVNRLTKAKADELKKELKMEDTYNIEITKSRYARGGAIKIGDRVKSTTFKGISGTILSKNKAGYYFVRLDETLPNGDYQHEVLRIDEVEKMSTGGNTERDAVEFFTDGGIGMKYIVNGKFDSARFKNDMITRTSKPNAESTIKHWGREMGINVSKYIDGDIIENTDFAEDSTKRAKQLFMAFNKKKSTGGSMYAGGGNIVMHEGKKYKKQSNGKWVEISTHGLTKEEHSKKINEFASKPNAHWEYNFHMANANKLSNKEYTADEIGLGKNKMSTGGSMPKGWKHKMK